MELSQIFEFHEIMEKNNLIMTYEGEFNQDITKSVLSMTERNLTNDNVDAGVKKKVYNIMVEALQNICKHQYVDEFDRKSAIFLVGENTESYFVVSGNSIAVDKINLVKDKLDLINSKNKEELKQLYKEARLSSTVSDVGGAGLGFIDMARKSEHKLEYQFDKISDDIHYFSLLTKISKNASNES